MHPLAIMQVQTGLLREVRLTRVGEKEMPPKSNHLKKDLENKEKRLGSTSN